MRGDDRIFQRGAVWWVEYWHRGTRVRESSKSTDRRVAQRLLQARRRTAGTAQFIAPKTEQLPFPALAALYLKDQRDNRRRSLDHAERYVRNLLAAFGDDRALDVTADRIETYRDQRRADGLRARTLQLRAAHAKNKRAKLLPLTAALLALIERRAAARDLACPSVFPGAAGGRLGDFSKAWKRARATAGVRGVVFHDLRRSGARNAVRAGVPEQVVMELGGWRACEWLCRRPSGGCPEDSPTPRRTDTEPTQSGFRRPRPPPETAINHSKIKWRRPGSNRGPRDYES